MKEDLHLLWLPMRGWLEGKQQRIWTPRRGRRKIEDHISNLIFLLYSASLMKYQLTLELLRKAYSGFCICMQDVALGS